MSYNSSASDCFMATRVPQGLASVIEDLAREVIRHQPDNIYTFAAQHFENLLKIRNNDENNSKKSRKSDDFICTDDDDEVWLSTPKRANNTKKHNEKNDTSSEELDVKSKNKSQQQKSKEKITKKVKSVTRKTWVEKPQSREQLFKDLHDNNNSKKLTQRRRERSKNRSIVSSSSQNQIERSTTSTTTDISKSYTREELIYESTYETQANSPPPTNYVERVQRVIDETAPLIKSKVDDLRRTIVVSNNERSKSVDSKEHVVFAPVRRVSSAKDLDKSGNSSKIMLPIVRSSSSANGSRGVSRSNSETLILPPISPEVSKFTKKKEPSLVLPTLAKDTLNQEVYDLLCDREIERFDDSSFHDSLNVTPRKSSSPKRPDSLESKVDTDEEELDLSKDLLVNDEQLKKVEETLLQEMDDFGLKSVTIREKLREVEESEKRIGEILSKSTTNDQQQEEIEKSDSYEYLRMKVDPFSYVLTEGSPEDIPESVTTVIIPDTFNPPSSDDPLLSPSRGKRYIESCFFTNDDHSENIQDVYVSNQEPQLEIYKLKKLKSEQSFTKLDLEDIEESDEIFGEDLLPNKKKTTEAASDSSNEAKETSATDENTEIASELIESSIKMESPKETESTNEAKESSVGDDQPTRPPYVPELNLDSLQDITVSSFKFSDDENASAGSSSNNAETKECTREDEISSKIVELSDESIHNITDQLLHDEQEINILQDMETKNSLKSITLIQAGANNVIIFIKNRDKMVNL